MTEPQELLANFVKNGSEPAFRELVTRFFDLVYSTAVRLVDGDMHRAEDVSQIVFADLAKMAGRLSVCSTLGGWLHRHTCFVARNVMRAERRRQTRERQAVEMNALNDQTNSVLALIAPIVDEAIQELGPDDRDAILLRFFERRNLRSVGEALGTNENVAQKRVARAVEALGILLQRRGVSFTTAVLAGALATGAVTAAPAGLALSVAGAVLASGVSTGAVGLTSAKVALVAKLKIAAVSSIVAGGIASIIFLLTQSRPSAVATSPLQVAVLAAANNTPDTSEVPEVAATISNVRAAEASLLNAAPSKTAYAGPKGFAELNARAPESTHQPTSAVVVGPSARYSAKSGSKVRIEGTSTLHDWQAESSIIGGFLEVGPDFPMKPGVKMKPGPVEAHAEIIVPVRSLQSVDQAGKHFSDRMDEIIWDNLRAHQYPKIQYLSEELSLIRTTNDSNAVSYECESRGKLVVGGFTNQVTVPIFILPLLGENKVIVSGRTSIKMSSFQIDPRPNVGLPMQVGDEVSVSFDWVVGSNAVRSTRARSGWVPLVLELPASVFDRVPSELLRTRNLEPLAESPRPPIMVPPGLKNIATRSKLTSSDKNATADVLAKITDGNKEASDRGIL